MAGRAKIAYLQAEFDGHGGQLITGPGDRDTAGAQATLEKILTNDKLCGYLKVSKSPLYKPTEGRILSQKVAL
jgi:hypothetical protein